MKVLLYGQIGLMAALLMSVSSNSFAKDSWHVMPNTLTTNWTDKVSPENVLPEYPRPQMERADWQNLNGLWDYAITAKDADCPQKWDGEILVPFGVEAPLSGVKKHLQPDQCLWYKRNIDVKPAWVSGKERLLLHFGAVDWDCKAYINNKLVGEHKGGYDSFTFDITDFVKPGANELRLSVLDPSNSGYTAFGKQASSPEAAWYTSTSGIWQTIWLEPVPKTYISDIKAIPDISSGTLNLKVILCGQSSDCKIKASAAVGGSIVGSAIADAGKDISINIPGPHLWSPDDPFLYDLNIVVSRKGKTVDSVKSYFGMRSIKVAKDSNGYDRIMLNGKPVFNLGVLDQGFWPDGIYTAPTDEALCSDVENIKKMGFNTIRKHMKIEPDRWYYHCDKLGMLVWQDMPARHPAIRKETDNPEYEKQFESEIQAMINTHINHPSIINWVLFNECWGMYDTKRIATWMKELDPSRLVDAHSCGDNEGAGDFSDVHIYCYPGMPAKQDGKASVLGEFGGVNDVIGGHELKPGDQWGHGRVKNGDIAFIYEDIVNHLKPLIVSGLCGAIYTQPYDVEVEENGLMTYDRKVFKIQPEWMNIVNQSIYGYISSKVTYVMPLADKENSIWSYVTDKPSNDWFEAKYDDSSWKTGNAPFGDNGGKTALSGADIWLRRSIEIKKDVPNPYFAIVNNDLAEVYIDGNLAGGTSGFSGQCVLVPGFSDAPELLKSGTHVLAVHIKRVDGRPVDFGIADVEK